MNIYIDESGGFIPQDGVQHKASAVVGLVVPSERRALLGREFKRFRKRVRPEQMELKGSTITEREAQEFCGLLAAHGVLLDAMVFDGGAHTNAEIEEFKILQAERITESLTREHYPTMVEEAVHLAQITERLSNQLFVQAFCCTQLIKDIWEKSRNYYALRSPRELGTYAWLVDAKARAITDMEYLWSILSVVVLSGKAIGEIPGGDYSHGEHYAPKRPSPPITPRERGQIDLGRAIRDSMDFADSKSDLGLQMVDICSGILTRGLNGKMAEAGWRGLGPLFVRAQDTAVKVMVLSTKAGYERPFTVLNHPWTPVLNTLSASAQPMILPAHFGQVRAAFRSMGS